MERIEKALEKAREQRKNLAARDPLSPTHENPKSLVREKSMGTDAAPSSANRPPHVDYVKTRIQTVSPRVLRKRRVIAGSVQNPEADIFRMLRAQVLQRLGEIGGTTLGICSPNPQEGKTLTAVNLAISLALDINYTVLLVDLDLRRPNLASYLGLKVRQGLIDYLFDQAELSDCLINPGIERLVLLPAGRALYNSSEALTSPKMVNLAQELKVRYPDRVVIYDMPPLLSSDDCLVFLPQLDAILLVVQEGKTRAAEIQRALDLLEGNNLIGTVLNRSLERNSYAYY